MPVFATVLIAALASAAPSPTPLPTLAPAMMKLAMPSFGPSTPAIAVKVNQPFQIRMKASAGTGYSWRPRGPLPPNLALLGAFEQPNGKAMPGAAGTQTLVFRGSSSRKVRAHAGIRPSLGTQRQTRQSANVQRHGPQITHAATTPPLVRIVSARRRASRASAAALDAGPPRRDALHRHSPSVRTVVQAALHEIDRPSCGHWTADELLPVAKHFRRVHTIQRLIEQQVDVLETMTPQEFNAVSRPPQSGQRLSIDSVSRTGVSLRRSPHRNAASHSSR